jgi:hypothetical protein
VECGDDGGIAPDVGGGSPLEAAVAGASCRAAVATSTSRVVTEAYSSSRWRAMACTWA